MTTKFHILDHTGHTTLDFDKTDTSAAMAKFEELVKEQKFSAFAKTSTPWERRQIRSFDPSAEDVLFVPPLQGG